MVFVAKLRRQSRVWTAWHHRKAVSGAIEGVPFRWLPGGDYATGELDADQVMRLRGQPDVLLEAYGAAPAVEPEARRMPEPAAPVPDATAIRAGTLTLGAMGSAKSVPHAPGWRQRQRELNRATDART